MTRAMIGLVCRAVDLAIWLWTILFRGEACRPYNVGSDQEITIADLARTVSSVLPDRPSPQLLTPSTPGFNLPPSRYVPCVERASSELGLQPLVSLETAIRKVAEFAQKVSF